MRQTPRRIAPRRTFPPVAGIVLLALLVIAGIAGLAYQQQVRSQVRYFPETGFAVREPFLDTFTANGGIATFGYPLSDAYRDSDDTLTQIFQNAKLNLTVRGVELAPLASSLGFGDPAGGTFAVDDTFADYYTSLGGEAFLGAPVGPAQSQNGTMVQNFERARLIVDPVGTVALGNLGSLYASAYPPPSTDGLFQFRRRGTLTPPPAFRVSVSVANPTVASDGEQTIYLIVEDMDGNPVEGVQSLAVLRFGIGTAEVELSPTDSHGLASARFIVPPAEPGSQVRVEIHALAGEVLLSGQTTYFQWW